MEMDMLVVSDNMRRMGINTMGGKGCKKKRNLE